MTGIASDPVVKNRCSARTHFLNSWYKNYYIANFWYVKKGILKNPSRILTPSKLAVLRCFEDLYTPAIPVQTLPLEGPMILWEGVHLNQKLQNVEVY